MSEDLISKDTLVSITLTADEWYEVAKYMGIAGVICASRYEAKMIAEKMNAQMNEAIVEYQKEEK